MLQYAGAKRPIYINTEQFKQISINEENLRLHENLNGQMLYEIKGSNSSIGGIGLNFEIQEQVFEYKKGDTIYLSSDGYADQFGGNNDKKYRTKNLKNLLLSIKNLEIKNQGQIMLNEFENWKGDTEQTDDVTVFGIKL